MIYTSGSTGRPKAVLVSHEGLASFSAAEVERFGVAQGAWLTLKRLLRCHPFSGKFGHDPVPDQQPSEQRSLIVQKEAHP